MAEIPDEESLSFQDRKDKIVRKTVTDMKKLGVFKKEYARMIDMFADLVAQYELLSVKFKDSGFEVEVMTDQGGSKKSPVVATLETLRKDILAYSDRLCLNPRAKSMTPDKKGSGTSRLAGKLKGR
ncbi:P27 family phage terminase small subunit [Paenibacillus sp. KR2-11]|uniref:P27 family phage terminase small subunit n=1 Tax=Paenibacillus sp. KR2-11 TaxID=3385500 RepID=UPI0038FC31D1